MEYVSDVALVLISVVNLAIILVTCVLNPGVKKHTKKKNMMAITILLSITLVFDAICLAMFVWQGLGENCKIFVMWFPLLGYLLYEDIKDLKANSK